MEVHEAGHHRLPRGVDDIGTLRDLNVPRAAHADYLGALDQDGAGFWGFGRLAIPESPLTVLASYMNWDPDTSMDDDTMTLLLIGLDYTPGKGLSIIPNFHQTKRGSGDPTNIFRVTFNWEW